MITIILCTCTLIVVSISNNLCIYVESVRTSMSCCLLFKSLQRLFSTSSGQVLHKADGNVASIHWSNALLNALSTAVPDFSLLARSRCSRYVLDPFCLSRKAT